MAQLNFTDRELKRSYRNLISAWQCSSAISNEYRLMLFYAVECGLKAVWLKRNSRNIFEKTDIEKTGHDLARIIKDLNISSEYFLPDQIFLNPVKVSGVQQPRNGRFNELHQVWRYGGVCSSPSDVELEEKLQKVKDWIDGELS